jgi:hypothetical protein
VEAEIKAVAGALGYGLHVWSTTEGLIDTAGGQGRHAHDPLEAVGELPENTLVLLREFHMFLDDGKCTSRRADSSTAVTKTALLPALDQESGNQSSRRPEGDETLLYNVALNSLFELRS